MTLDGLSLSFSVIYLDLCPDAEATLRTTRVRVNQGQGNLILFLWWSSSFWECRNKSTLSRWGPCAPVAVILVRTIAVLCPIFSLGGFPIIRSFEGPQSATKRKVT
jgi:hypothetical protein